MSLTKIKANMTDFTEPIGYGAGGGGTVTQLTSKSTAVTLNKPSGVITTNNELLASGTWVGFNCNNTFCTSNDTVIANIAAGGAITNYTLRVQPGTNVITFYIKNDSGGNLSEALAINFAVIKGAIT